MKNYTWKTIYFDGFAGSGTNENESQTTLYKQLLITQEEETVYKGAAERVLELEGDLKFDYYYFIDKRESSLQKLEKRLIEKNALNNKKVVFKSGDVNKSLGDLADALKTKKYAALILLDPFGMQIDWSSIEQLKDTRSDVWILVPTGVIVNRLLDKAGELKHSAKLQSFFGLTEAEIRTAFYMQKTTNTLFGEEAIVQKVSQPIEKIARLYAVRLKTIWRHVTDEPLRLDNRNGVPLFHFVFASNNANALKIAKDIIKNI